MSWSVGAWRVVALGAALWFGSSLAGCSFEVAGLAPEDARAAVEVDDLAPGRGDLADGVVDLADVDLAGVDLAGDDLAPPVDLAPPPDLVAPPDLVTPPDLTPVAVLSCTVEATPAAVKLSDVGTIDWVQFGRGIIDTRNEKSGAAAIGALSAATTQRFTDGEVSFSWTGGDPTQTENDTKSGFYYYTGTFSLGVAASETTTQRLRVYVGGWRSRGRFTASLPGAQGCDDTTQKGEGGGWNVTYTILFRAAQPNQTLTVTWQREQAYDTFGNVRFEAAALDPAP
jgi:hypothetical protein